MAGTVTRGGAIRAGSTGSCWAARCLLAVLLVSSLGCGAPPGEDEATRPDAGFEETGDLSALLEHGQLRILLPVSESPRLPRRGFTNDAELELADLLAESLDLTPVLIYIADRSKLLDALEQGRGDLLIARLTITASRRNRFSFSVPVDRVREVLVTRADFPTIEGASDLEGLTIAVRRSSSFYETVSSLREKVPFELVLAPETQDTEDLIYGVAVGDYHATVADEDMLEAVLEYRDDVRAALALTRPRPIAWAMRKGVPELKDAVDLFLHEHALTSDLDERLYGDLDEIRERRVLRVLTRNNAASYFLHRGHERGFEFELARAFARRIGCRLQILLPPEGNQLIPWLLEGRGDLIAASMTVRPSREAWVNFTRSYIEPREVVVARLDDVGLSSLDDLRGRTIHLRRSSSYFESLAGLEEEFGFELDFVPEVYETEEIIARVGSGEYDLTVADEHILGIELAYRDDVRAAFALGPPRQIAWAMRKEDRGLLAEADQFLTDQRGSTFFNVLQGKYFRDQARIRSVVPERDRTLERISPYDGLFRRYGRLYGLDWRLLGAQAYQESRFDPSAVSSAGALGIMQVMPRTARELGVEGDLRDPETSIATGSRYLRKLAEQFEPGLSQGERLRFALASYNAGRGHVLDGRRLARDKGLDPDRWFDNVERVMPLLSRREYASRARFGYCRCRQPIAYVRAINDRYAIYTTLFPETTDSVERPAASETETALSPP